MILSPTTRRKLAFVGFVLSAGALVAGAFLVAVNPSTAFLFGVLGYFGMQGFSYLQSY